MQMGLVDGSGEGRGYEGGGGGGGEFGERALKSKWK